jgi:hypothetical protein
MIPAKSQGDMQAVDVIDVEALMMKAFSSNCYKTHKNALEDCQTFRG